MAKIGIFYGSTSGVTAEIAETIHEKLGEELCDIIDMEEDYDEFSQLLEYDYLLLGCSTWGAGEVQNAWREPLFDMDIEKPDFTGKIIALFGAADQVGHGKHFAGALQLMCDQFEKLGATIVGEFPTEGYTFEHSSAVRNGKFVGLPLDEVNQSDLTEERITQWLETLRPIFLGEEAPVLVSA
ncbi:flavodoxin [Hydrocoleum sp. CS-953]|uniref:flavodoxin n=1 Tax=Microcoleaceae TaxID=1892252 RepID=UPI000B9C5BA5|nr:flavodoxin [Hydrocoleum sp. CS-953]OZH54392.1 flavodoxin [Hydrocoleum sp. CS-953]